MCGIAGYVGEREAVPLVLEGLKSLEYRGYDSAGIAVLSEGKIDRRRASGKLVNLKNLLRKETLDGSPALGHTRWATHGRPSEENAHPHADCSGSLVVIHNGIIENFLELKDRLTQQGHHFASDTDTEVIAHLIEENFSALIKASSNGNKKSGEKNFFEAVRLTLQDLKGAYALAIISAHAPGSLIAAKSASPLVIGLGEGENFLASDVPAFLEYTRQAVFLNDGEMALLKASSCEFFDIAGHPIQKKPVQISWDRSMAEKGGYRHFMLKEIHEQPEACEETLRGRIFPLVEGALEKEAGFKSGYLKSVKAIYMVGCGTAYHACRVAKFWLEEMVGLPIFVEIGSEFRYRDVRLEEGDLVVAVSQSGETADTLASIRLAKSKKVPILAITNTLGSAISREADYNLYTRCGPELGVASTKAFTGQLAALFAFALHMGLSRKTLPKAKALELAREAAHIPTLIRETLKLEEKTRQIAKNFFKSRNFIFIGRRLNYPIALEAALKLKEISYIHAEGFAAGELKHGSIALIDEEMPVVAIATHSPVFDKTVSNCEEIRARGGQVIMLKTKGDPEVRADYVLELPMISEALAPILSVIPLQMLAYYVAALRGLDIDQPRNLAKSVTVE